MSEGRPPRRGWTVFMNEDPVEETLAMPGELQERIVNFCKALAIEAGSAIDAGKTPPGDPLDAHGIDYSLVIEGEPVIVEYTVIRDIREIRISTLV